LSMKSIISTVIAVAFVVHTQAQTRALVDSTGLPGDGFDLAGAVELFKQAPNLEAFERALNEEASQVNNLDLDGDERVDHIRVVDHKSGEAHAIVLQVALSQSELQDVAVIELEKTGEAAAMLQIRGAEELYGSDVLVGERLGLALCHVDLRAQLCGLAVAVVLGPLPTVVAALEADGLASVVPLEPPLSCMVQAGVRVQCAERTCRVSS
jgi:hypothetical protein